MSRLPLLRTAAEDSLAVLTALLLFLTGCGVVDRDDRPESDYATFAQEVAALPAIASVDADPDAPAEMAGRSFAAELPDLTEPTDLADAADVADHAATDGPDTADLKTTGDRITSLLDDYHYPDGVPSLTLTSGS